MKPKTWAMPKFSRLCKELCLPKATVVGILECLWYLAATFDAENGEIKSTPEELAAFLEIDLTDEGLKKLIDCRWLDRYEDGRLFVHDWNDHKPNYIKERDRKRKYREGKQGLKRVNNSPPSSMDTSISVPGQSGTIRKSDPPSYSYSYSLSSSSKTQKKEKILKKESLSTSVDGGCPSGGVKTLDLIMQIWNDKAANHPNLKPIRKLTAGRIKKLNARIKSNSDFLDLFKEAIQKLPFRESAEFTWQPDFDFLIRNDETALSVVEGKYDFRQRAKTPEEARAEAEKKKQQERYERELAIRKKALADRARAEAEQKRLQLLDRQKLLQGGKANHGNNGHEF